MRKRRLPKRHKPVQRVCLCNRTKPRPIMIMTGYGENLQQAGAEIPRVIAKPVALKVLATAIREMLDKS